jgi:hypothetical protein
MSSKQVGDLKKNLPISQCMLFSPTPTFLNIVLLPLAQQHALVKLVIIRALVNLHAWGVQVENILLVGVLVAWSVPGELIQ